MKAKMILQMSLRIVSNRMQPMVKRKAQRSFWGGPRHPERQTATERLTKQ